MLLFAATLVLMLGFVGIAMDTARLYNRKVELQNIANAVALAAASQLNGTPDGISRALSKGSQIARTFTYKYYTQPVTWSDAAIKFSSSPDPDGIWNDATSANSAPNGVLFAKVETRELGAEMSAISTTFMHMLSSSFSEMSMTGRAIAGRSAINVTPLALCAMSNNPGESRANPGPPANTELVEYGFRRGVSYDLMQLNPGGTTPENFIISPVDPPGTVGSSTNTSPSVVEPFVCAGKLSIPRITGAPITVARPFPIDSLFAALNSRFDQYAGSTCSPEGAPPDANIRPYPYTSIAWMSTVPSTQTAFRSTADGKLWTIADPWPALVGNTAPMYGPLWAYAKAVPFSAYVQNELEPSAGYATFNTSAWSTLYKPGQPAASGSYSNSSTPYRAIAGANFLAPSMANRPGVRLRRVLRVPLLSCPLPAGANVTGTVLAIANFFMTVPATATSISAEFAGISYEQSLGSSVELYP